ncbi:hypothetical protein HG537_0B02670 [Torulaspora globosa]|uniref:EF-hand domain-containing protein n=1 Tax=Torulaspora globosa TaxID=48254 RepID=A0A7H9HNV4_9SACH|nr:hypothetical protein HG537_0B02670 [Torulaspora sp. CBS 2947]
MDNSRRDPNENSDKRYDRYEQLFRKLDVNGTGKLDLQSLQKALEKDGHPLRDSNEAIMVLFNAMDCDKDSIVDLEDFSKYASIAESQIEKGFKRLDSDHDGKVKLSEVSEYLSKLDKNCSKPRQLDQLEKSLDGERKASRFNTFLNWAFLKKPKGEDKPRYITYDQWRDFLLLMPRKEGSRLHTAYAYYCYFNADVDLSSEGDMTLINDFINGFGYFIAGGVSGVISRTCTAPLDRLKVFLIARTDLSSTLLNSKESLLAKNPNANLAKIRSPLVKAITTLYRQGGLRAFYVGNGLNVIKVFPESSMKFGSFELTKKLMTKLEGCRETSELSKFSTYIAGGMAGVVAQFSVYPIDTLKFRIQCAPLDNQVKGNKLLLQTAKEMYQAGGLKLFYRGVTVGVVGIFPYAALDLGTFSALKKRYIARKAKQLSIPESDVSLSNLVVLPMGAFSGTVGATVVYPINLLRTRLQAQGTFAHPATYTGFRDVLVKTIQREGYPGLFKGLVPNLAKVCPAVSISYLCYENLKSLMKLG